MGGGKIHNKELGNDSLVEKSRMMLQECDK
jgi:hypothetical protein